MEPTCTRVRPIPMRLLAATAVLCLGTLSACGSADEPAQAGDHRSTPSATASTCVQDGASTDAEVDLDGDGKPEEVSASSSGECPGSVSAEVAGAMVSAPIQDPTPVTKVLGVLLQGHTGQLVVTRQDHPRGGYQLRIYTLDDDKLTELTDGDQPLVPFVATDVRPISATVDCKGDDIVVTRAAAGTGGTWDIRSTSYGVDGSNVTRAGSTVVTSNASPKKADQLMPVGAAVFPSCSS